VFRISVDL
jgi:hypothetical protein